MNPHRIATRNAILNHLGFIVWKNQTSLYAITNNGLFSSLFSLVDDGLVEEWAVCGQVFYRKTKIAKELQ